jgi:hypothetical protein
MRRVVITGMGIVSPLGDTLATVLSSLQESRSGIRYHEPYREIGLRSHLGGFTQVNLHEQIDKKNLRFMGNAAAYASIAMQQAINDAGLVEEEVSHPRTGLIIGSGGTSAENVVAAADTMREKGLKRLSPFMVPRTMSSTVSACLTSAFRIKGVCYSISSACATGSHCIGAALAPMKSTGAKPPCSTPWGRSLPDSTTLRNGHPDPTTATGTVLSLPTAQASWSLKNWNAPKNVAQGYTGKLSDTEQPPMATRWSPPPGKVRPAASG